LRLLYRTQVLYKQPERRNGVSHRISMYKTTPRLTTKPPSLGRANPGKVPPKKQKSRT
jgi:hypothetical protein